MSKSLPVLAVITQPGPVGWWCDSGVLSLALPGCAHTQKVLVLPGQDLKNVKLLVSLLFIDAGLLFKTRPTVCLQPCRC